MNWAIRQVWLRYFDVYRKSLVYGLTTTLVMPLMYLTAFGFGLGAIMSEIQIGGKLIPYRQFVFAGILGQTLLFQSYFEAAYGGFVRMYYQRIFQSISVTPITLHEVLWGELFWDASKATFAGSVLMALAILVGDFELLPCLIFLPLAFSSALMFSALGLLSAAISKTIDDISYPQLLFVMPMFLFCGVFYPIENLPYGVRFVVELLPLSAVVGLARSLILELPMMSKDIVVFFFWLIALVPSSIHFMARRLVK